jgi:hypothetical protein
MSYTIWLSVIVDEEGAQPRVGMTNQQGGVDYRPETDSDLEKARRAHNLFERVITFAETVR